MMQFFWEKAKHSRSYERVWNKWYDVDRFAEGDGFVELYGLIWLLDGGRSGGVLWWCGDFHAQVYNTGKIAKVCNTGRIYYWCVTIDLIILFNITIITYIKTRTDLYCNWIQYVTFMEYSFVTAVQLEIWTQLQYGSQYGHSLKWTFVYVTCANYLPQLKPLYMLQKLKISSKTIEGIF